MKYPRIQLIVRGDDAGSCESADLAILEACDHGIVRNVSIMVPGPSFAHAARLLSARRELCLGLHVTLNAEWETWRWGPVLPPDQVPSLVDDKGCFLPSPRDLHARGFNADEAMAEIEAQLRKAREAGLEIRYLDEHMGVSWVGGLRARLVDLTRREGLVDAAAFTGLPSAGGQSGRWVDGLRAGLQRATPGVYVQINHPGMDRSDMQQFTMPGQVPGVVARERDAERRGLRDPALMAILQEYGVRLCRYSEVSPG